MSTPPNPLDKFRTYSYHHFLYASYHTEGLRNLFGTEKTIKDVTGRPVKELQDVGDQFTSLMQKYKNREDKTGINFEQDPVLLVINPLKDTDFVIESVNYNVMTSGDFQNGAHLIKGDLKLIVHETYGVSFLNYLKFMAEEIFECNWSGIAFALKTVMIGHADDGTVKYFTVKPKILMLHNVEVQFGEAGSVYTLSFLDYSMGAAVGDASYGRINKAISITTQGAATLGKVLNNLETQLNNVVSTGANELSKKVLGSSGGASPRFGRQVNYKITVTDEAWANSTIQILPGASLLDLASGPTSAAKEFVCDVITEKQAADEKAAAEAAKPSKAEEEKVAEDNAKYEKRWKDYFAFMTVGETFYHGGRGATLQRANPANPKWASLSPKPDDPATGMDQDALLHAQCRWMKAWNDAHDDDKVYAPPVSPAVLAKQKKEAEAKAAAAKKNPTEQNPGSFQAKQNVSIHTVISEILKRCDSIKKDCNDELAKEFNETRQKLNEATKAKQAKEQKREFDEDYKTISTQQLELQQRYNVLLSNDNLGALKVISIRNSITSDAKSITVHYDIIKKFLPDPRARKQAQLSAGTTVTDKNPNGSTIEYDYLFTGKNSDILTYDMKLNQGIVYLMNDQLVTDSVASTVTAGKEINPDGSITILNVPLAGTAGDNQVLKVKLPNSNQVKVIRKNDPILMPQLLGEENASGMSSWKQESIATHREYMTVFTKFAAMGNLTAGMKIRGNPDLLNSCASTIYPHDINEYDARLRKEAAIAERIAKNKGGRIELSTTEENLINEVDMVHMPLFLKVNVKMPFGAKSKVGTVDNLIDTYSNNRFQKFWYDGWYWVQEIDNTFEASGEFTQTIKMMEYNIGDVFSPEGGITK